MKICPSNHICIKHNKLNGFKMGCSVPNLLFDEIFRVRMRPCISDSMATIDPLPILTDFDL